MAKVAVLTPQRDDFPRWYQETVARAELAENGPVRGTMVIRPYGYALWERMQTELDTRIKEAGAVNAYFPLLIPESLLRRETEHIEGFSPELAVVTHGGGKQLEAPAVIRPTSETITNWYFAKWIQSYRGLPLLINQWANVVRWEMRPRLFLRTTEFLWQEGHTAHATHGDARAYAIKILRDVYEDFMIHVLAIPVRVGRKTERERFAGAETSWTCEATMRDGKALQVATSHELGQNFARVFETTYLSETGQEELVWQTSWGASTRMVGALIMSHGDDAGLRVPPRLAPIQVVVLIVRAEEGAAEAATHLVADLRRSGVRVELDDRVHVAFGRRAVDWELKGVPVRVEIGPRDVAKGTVSLVKRSAGSKEALAIGSAAASIPSVLNEIQATLLREATELRDKRTSDIGDLSQAQGAAQDGFARIPWKQVGAEGEARLAKSGISVRCLQRHDGGLAVDPDASDVVAYIARAY